MLPAQQRNPDVCSFPEKEGWDRILGLNVKAVYYREYAQWSSSLLRLTVAHHLSHRRVCAQAHQVATQLTYVDRLTEELAKDSTVDDPARVINISSIAAVNTVAEGSALADKGNGLWSCESPSTYPSWRRAG